MPEQGGYTYDELIKMGAKPGGYSYEELTSLGAKPAGVSPSLLASRQAASASEFDKNNPGSTMATRANAVGQGINDATGGILGDTLSGNASGLVDKAKNILGGLYGLGKGAVTHPVDTAVNAVKGVGESLIAGPQQALQGLSEGDYDKMAEGVGGTVATDFPAAYGAAKGTEALVGKARRVLAGGDVGYIEQQIAPSGREAQAVTQKIAPELAKDSALVKSARQAVYDKVTWSNLKAAEHQLVAAEQSVPAGTTISKADLLTDIQSNIDALQVPGAPVTTQVPTTTPGKGITGFQPQTTATEVTGHPDAFKALVDAKNEISKFPDSIPFEDALKFRRQLDKAIYTSGGWKETGTAAERAAMMARRDVANALRARLGVTSEMQAANKAYGLAADNVSASGLNWENGRRLSATGKATLAQKAAKYAGKAAIGGGLVGLGYELSK